MLALILANPPRKADRNRSVDVLNQSPPVNLTYSQHTTGSSHNVSSDSRMESEGSSSARNISLQQVLSEEGRAVQPSESRSLIEVRLGGDKVQGGTIIICPLSVMLSWQDQAFLQHPSLHAKCIVLCIFNFSSSSSLSRAIREISWLMPLSKQISQHVQPGNLKLGVFHGSSRHGMIERLHEYDIVLTTYDTLRIELLTYATQLSAASNGQRKNKPSSKLSGTKRSKTGKPLTTSRNDNPSTNITRMEKNNISTSEGLKMTSNLSTFPITRKTLFDIKWWRVILDEAHMVKARDSMAHRACDSLSTVHRWCLTGTPLQEKKILHNFLIKTSLIHGVFVLRKSSRANRCLNL